jgi:type II secretory pathway pseudopilin PulG
MIRRHRRSGITLFQLLIVLAVLAILLGLLLPAVQKIRAAASRMQSQNNLKQIALATINYADTYRGDLPAGVDDKYFSASSRILPFMEQDALYNTIDFKKSIDDKANAAARRTAIKTFLSPDDPVHQVKPEWGATNYVFNDQVFFLNSKLRYPASITDGTSNTIFTGETLKGDGGTKAVTVQRQYVLLDKDALKGIKAEAGVADWTAGKHIAGDRCASWMDGRFLQGTFNGELRPNDERPDVSCAGTGGVSGLRSLDKTILAGMGDGSVRSVDAKKISHETWKAALTPSGGEVLGPDF